MKKLEYKIDRDNTNIWKFAAFRKDPWLFFFKKWVRLAGDDDLVYLKRRIENDVIDRTKVPIYKEFTFEKE